jgi:hypothetical protein
MKTYNFWHQALKGRNISAMGNAHRYFLATINKKYNQTILTGQPHRINYELMN